MNPLLLRVLAKAGALKYLNLYKEVYLNGKPIKVPILAGIGLGLGSSEPWLNRVVKTALELSHGAFLDVGMNLGQTLLKLIQYSDDIHYYGFEPNPQCVAYVEALKNLNNWRNVHLIPVGLSDRHYLAQMSLRSEQDPAASIVAGYRPAREYSQNKYVPIFKGDDLIEQLGIKSISMIKIDVEGAEAEVLNSLRGTIKQVRPIVYCEILPISSYNAPEIINMRREKADQILQFTSEVKYQIFRLLHDGQIIPLKTIESHANLMWSEYLLLPEESAEAVQVRLRESQ